MSRGWKYILEPLYTVHYHSGMLNMQFRNNTCFGPEMLQKLSEEGGKPSKPITFLLLYKLRAFPYLLGKLFSLRFFMNEYFIFFSVLMNRVSITRFIKTKISKKYSLTKNLRENKFPDIRTAFGDICFENRGRIPMDIHRL